MDTTHTYVQDEQRVLHFTVENIYFFYNMLWCSEKNTGLEIQSIGISLFCY